MDFKEMNNRDLEFFLLSGSGIKVNNLNIVPYTLREITQYGYSRYMSSIQFISHTKDDLINLISDVKKREYLKEQIDSLRTFDLYIGFGNEEILEYFLSAIAMIFKTNDVLMIDKKIAINFLKLGILKIDEHGNIVPNEECEIDTSEENLLLIDRDNFDDIIKIVKLQNYLIKLEDDEQEFDLSKADEATRKLIEQQKQYEEKVEKLKRKQLKKDGEDIDITDIISAVSSKSYSINELNIWDLTIYQLYKKYARLEVIDNHDFAIRALMAGAKDVSLSHWSSKI